MSDTTREAALDELVRIAQEAGEYGQPLVDWSKPIQFANGEPCRLIRTFPDGTHEILREGVTDMTAYWTVPADGGAAPGTLCHRMRMWIVNKTEVTNDG